MPTELQQPRDSTNYSIATTDTFRLASRMLTVRFTTPPRDGKVGSNLQNKEKGMRKIYIPDNGRMFVQVDESGAEALIVAYLCRHGNFRDLFLNNVKSHVYVALHVFADIWKKELENTGVNIRELVDSPINELTKNPYWKSVDKLIKSSDSWPAERRYYYISKQICHACLTNEHEVMTKSGWIRINEMPPEILVFNMLDFSSHYENVEWNKYDYTGNMIVFSGNDVYQKVTPEHKIPFYQGDIVAVQQAQYVRERTKKCCLLSQAFKQRLFCNISEDYYEGNVYCPTTSTGYFVIRCRGKVSITGNSNYGMKAGMFQLNTLEKSKGKIVISKKDAEMYLGTYHGLFPEIHGWHRDVEDQLSKTRTLYNLFGFPREFWYPSNNPPEQLLKKAYAFIPQSTVGTITNIAYTKLQTYIEDNKLNWDLLANTHDSYLVQCPPEEHKECARIMTMFMNQQLRSPKDGTIFSMKSEAQAGYNWSPADKEGIKNPDGLKEILV